MLTSETVYLVLRCTLKQVACLTWNFVKCSPNFAAIQCKSSLIAVELQLSVIPDPRRLSLSYPTGSTSGMPSTLQLLICTHTSLVEELIFVRHRNWAITLRWRQIGRDSVSNHQPHDCLPNRLFRGRSKKTSKRRVTGLCVGNSPGPVNSPHKGPVTRKMFPFHDVIMV